MIFEGPSRPKWFCDYTTTSVKRDGFAKSNVSPKRSQTAPTTVQIVKISRFGLNTVKKHSQAVSIIVYEFQVVLKTHAINNLLCSGMLLNSFQRPPFSSHLIGLEAPATSYPNYPSSQAKIHFTLPHRKTATNKYFPNSLVDLSMNEENTMGKR